MRNNAQSVSSRDEGWKGHLSSSGQGSLPDGSDLLTGSRLLYPVSGADIRPILVLSFSFLLPPGLQLFYVISIYINFNVVYFLKFPFVMLLNL